jgi:thiol-disulfide isomerase/thioredoxin
MKALASFVLISILLISCQTNTPEEIPNHATIKGTVVSDEITVVKFEYISDNPIKPQYETFEAKVMEDSSFEIEIPIQRLATGRITYNDFYHDICLLPGDDIYCIINGDTIQYSGKGASKNNFLYHTEKVDLTNLDYHGVTNDFRLSPFEIVAPLKEFKEKRQDFFIAYCDSVELEPQFIKHYEQETEIIYTYTILRYNWIYSYVTQTPIDSLEISDEFYRLSEFSEIIDDTKCNNSYYLDNILELSKNKARDLLSKDSTLKFKDAVNKVLRDSISGKTQEYALAKSIVDNFTHSTDYDSVAIDYFYSISNDELAKETVDKAVNKYLEKQKLIGAPLHPEFANTVLLDSSYNELSFGEIMESLEGKVVYVDFWSLACGPCIAAMPYSKILKEKLEGEDVEFVYISTLDLGEPYWENFYNTTQTKENHYIMKKGTESRLYKFLGISYVPCYMIFDKEGNCISFDAERPTKKVETEETELERTLRQLAKQ